MSNIVNVAWMYPDILNLHGERGNAKAFELVSKKMGVKLNIDRIDDIDSNINYENYDILLFNAGELKHIEKVKERLENDIDKIKEYIKNNNIIKIIQYQEKYKDEICDKHPIEIVPCSKSFLCFMISSPVFNIPNDSSRYFINSSSFAVKLIPLFFL